MRRCKKKPQKPRSDYRRLYGQQSEELERQRAVFERMILHYQKAIPEYVAMVDEVQRLKADMVAYKQRLAEALDPDQIEAAQITGCPPDEYAIQLIRLCKRKIDELKRFT